MHVSARAAVPPSDAVEIVIAEVPPGRRIEHVALIDPGGTRYPAEALAPVTRSESSGGARPRIGIGVSGGSSSRIRPSLSLGWNLLGGEAERSSRRVEGRVALPDPADFRASAARWRIEVIVTEIDGARRTLSFPAQAP